MIATTINQSKKLIELNIDKNTADMYYPYFGYLDNEYGKIPKVGKDFDSNKDLPCWSLSALLDLIPLPTLEKHNIGLFKYGWMISAYPNNTRYDSKYYDNTIDACIEIIIKLKKDNWI